MASYRHGRFRSRAPRDGGQELKGYAHRPDDPGTAVAAALILLLRRVPEAFACRLAAGSRGNLRSCRVSPMGAVRRHLAGLPGCPEAGLPLRDVRRPVSRRGFLVMDTPSAT